MALVSRNRCSSESKSNAATAGDLSVVADDCAAAEDTAADVCDEAAAFARDPAIASADSLERDEVAMLLCDLLMFDIGDVGTMMGASLVEDADEAEEGMITTCPLDVDDASGKTEEDIEDSNTDELDDDDALCGVCSDCGEHAVSKAPIKKQAIPTLTREMPRSGYLFAIISNLELEKWKRSGMDYPTLAKTIQPQSAINKFINELVS